MFRECFQHLYRIERKRIVTPENIHMRFNRGERPEELPFALQRAIRVALGHCGNKIQQYPSYQQFYQRVSATIAFPKEQIVVGAGIEEFIRTLMFLCCDPGQKAVVLWPTCAMYDIYAAAFGVDLIRIKPLPDVQFVVSEFIAAIPEDTRVVFVPNPGQPVETHFNVEQLKQLAEYCAQIDAVLAVDEAHYGFGASTALSLVNKYSNVLVMRTFSKFYAAASIRVGFVVGQERTIRTLDGVRPSGEIAGPSMVVAMILMEHHRDMVREAQKIAEARDWLRCAINGLGLRAWGSYGFSVLVQFKTSAQMEWVVGKMAAYGIYVKGSFPEPVERHILIACGLPKTMAQFFDVFKVVVACSNEVPKLYEEAL